VRVFRFKIPRKREKGIVSLRFPLFENRPSAPPVSSLSQYGDSPTPALPAVLSPTLFTFSTLVSDSCSGYTLKDTSIEEERRRNQKGREKREKEGEGEGSREGG
jgi:hypothetical protein